MQRSALLECPYGDEQEQVVIQCTPALLVFLRHNNREYACMLSAQPYFELAAMLLCHYPIQTTFCSGLTQQSCYVRGKVRRKHEYAYNGGPIVTATFCTAIAAILASS